MRRTLILATIAAAVAAAPASPAADTGSAQATLVVKSTR